MTKKAWQKQEERIAKDYGGKRQPGSGSGWAKKADVKVPEYLIEAKTTEGVGYRLTLKDLLSLGHYADVEGKVPVFAIQIQGHDYVVLREEDWMP